MMDDFYVKSEADSVGPDMPTPDEGDPDVREEEKAHSPAVSETDHVSGGGSNSSGDDDSSRRDRRKRKMPQRHDSYTADTEDIYHEDSSKDPLEMKVNASSHHSHDDVTASVTGGLLQSSLSAITEQRRIKQMENSRPRMDCPVCGEKANGLHYGIYSCEGCKNFFKRSVLVCATKPYVCKFDGDCRIKVTEIGGVKQNTKRCQACRYQACLDSGMYHSGTPRSRGGRYNYTPMPKTTNKIPLDVSPSSPAGGVVPSSKFPRLSLLAGDRASDSRSDTRRKGRGGVDVRSFEDGHAVNGASSLRRNFVGRVAAENAESELEMLKSRIRELESALKEKDRQLLISRRQIGVLNRSLMEADRVNAEQAAIIEASHGGEATGNGASNGSGSCSVTITPVIRRKQPDNASFVRSSAGSRGWSSSGGNDVMDDRNGCDNDDEIDDESLFLSALEPLTEVE